MSKDVTILRDLARQVAEIMAKPVQDERRDLWRWHNSLERTRPPVLSMGMPYCQEVIPDAALVCEDPFYRAQERSLRHMIFQDSLNDDMVIEPWISLRATFCPPTDQHCWGPEIRFRPSTEHRGSWMFDPPIRDEADIDTLVRPRHAIDEEQTARQFQKLGDAIGDILTIIFDRSPFYRGWHGDISTDVARLLGLEQFMVYMLDRPEWLHRILAFMRDGVLAVHEQAERAGDWRLCHHSNQAIAYAKELADPVADGPPVTRRDLWVFCASQETTAVSPAMFDEFMLQYQQPIIEQFGLSAYGCCEDLTGKIALLKRIRNLRRIAVTPWADLRKCVEQIGTDYVISWRPSPTDVICTGLNRDRLRRLIREGLEACRGCCVDITLKDHETIPDGADSLRECVRIMKQIAEEYA